MPKNNMPLEVAEQLVHTKYNTYNRYLKNGREKQLRETMLRLWHVAKMAWLEGDGCTFMDHEIEPDQLEEMVFRGWVKVRNAELTNMVWLGRAGKRVLGIEW